MSEVTITVSGRVGSGKSALLGEIEIMLKAIGVPVRFANPREARMEKHLTHADWQSDLELCQPTVVLVEEIAATNSKVLAYLYYDEYGNEMFAHPNGWRPSTGIPLGRIVPKVPLTDEQVGDLWRTGDCYGKPLAYCKAIEAAHGIGGKV